MKTPRFIISLVIVVIMLASGAFAQGGPDMGGPKTDLDPVFMKLFSTVKGFSAETHITVIEKGKKTPVSLEASYEYAEGNLRVDMDLTKMKSPDMSEEASVQLEMMGMAKMTTLTRIEKGTTTMIYPGLKAYAEMRNPQVSLATVKQEDSKLDMSDVGQETIDGHACVKKKVGMVADGKKREAFIWCAKDLKDFPIQMKVDDEGAVTTILFRKVKLEAPSATRFQIPAGYTAYTNLQQMMQTEMMKKMGGMGR